MFPASFQFNSDENFLLLCSLTLCWVYPRLICMTHCSGILAFHGCNKNKNQLYILNHKRLSLSLMNLSASCIRVSICPNTRAKHFMALTLCLFPQLPTPQCNVTHLQVVMQFCFVFGEKEHQQMRPWTAKPVIIQYFNYKGSESWINKLSVHAC